MGETIKDCDGNELRTGDEVTVAGGGTRCTPGCIESYQVRKVQRRRAVFPFKAGDEVVCKDSRCMPGYPKGLTEGRVYKVLRLDVVHIQGAPIPLVVVLDDLGEEFGYHAARFCDPSEFKPYDDTLRRERDAAREEAETLRRERDAALRERNAVETELERLRTQHVILNTDVLGSTAKAERRVEAAIAAARAFGVEIKFTDFGVVATGPQK